MMLPTITIIIATMIGMMLVTDRKTVTMISKFARTLLTSLIAIMQSCPCSGEGFIAPSPNSLQSGTWFSKQLIQFHQFDCVVRSKMLEPKSTKKKRDRLLHILVQRNVGLQSKAKTSYSLPVSA